MPLCKISLGHGRFGLGVGLVLISTLSSVLPVL